MAPAARHQHIVDELIAERAPRLSSSWAWPVARPVVYKLLNYRQARKVADDIAHMSGAEALAYASDMLRIRIETRGLEHLPRRGRVVIIINHPTGMVDGLAVHDAVKPIRPDFIFFANADALRVCPRFGEVFIPVEWVEEKRTREKARQVLEAAKAALEAERPLMISPAGRIARYREDGFCIDPPWATSAVSIARKYKAPILPMHIDGPPSTLFRLGHRVSQELRDITLFHELLNKKGGKFTLTAGPLIPHEAIGEVGAFTERLKRYIERELPVEPDKAFA
ncbi:MAG TPA: 1-acyl-sn-glycerol-3-phosphate acyltransferase [Caulobacteraceae bacterium]|jgi:putative hemolysin